MTKKLFTGERQNLPQLAEDVAAWLRQQGFEVQSGSGPNAHLVQARKQSTLRSLLGNNQSIDVKIEGTPDNYTIDVDAGQWVKNLKGSGPSAVVAALATVYTLGIAAAWSASERSQIESRLWALKDAACPSCRKLGAARHTGQRCVRVENVMRLLDGDHQGVKVFTDTYQCQFCPHAWDRGEQTRTVLLCPKCHEEGTKEGIGEFVFSTKKAEQKSQDGQPLAEQVFTNKFRCRECDHCWNDGQKSRLLEACPQCLKAGTRQPVGQVVTALRKTDRRRNDGLPLAEQVYTNRFRCGECGCEWDDGEKTRLLAVCPKCCKLKAVAKGQADPTDMCRCVGAVTGTSVGKGTLEGLYGRPVSGQELQLIDAFSWLCGRAAAAKAAEDRNFLVEIGEITEEEAASSPPDDGSVVAGYKPDSRWNGPRLTDDGELLIAVQGAGLLFGAKHLMWKTGKGAVPEGALPYADIDLQVLGCKQGTFGHSLSLTNQVVVGVEGGKCGAGLMANITVFLRVAAQLSKQPVEGDWKECVTFSTACPKCKTAIQVTGQSVLSTVCPTCSATFTPSLGQVAWGSVVADGLWGSIKAVGSAVGVAAVGLNAVFEAAGAYNCRHCGEPLKAGYNVCSHCGRSS